MIEKTQPKIFHIHIDAQSITKELHSYAKEELGFQDTNFDGHSEGYDHFEPQKHLTLKLKTREEFNQVRTLLEKQADESEFVGYLEGEIHTIR